ADGCASCPPSIRSDKKFISRSSRWRSDMRRMTSLAFFCLFLFAIGCSDETTPGGNGGDDAAMMNGGDGGGGGGDGGGGRGDLAGGGNDDGPPVQPPKAVHRPPVIYSDPNRSAAEGQRYQYAVLADDPDGDSLVFSLPKAPMGMSIDAATGLVSWT